jgi:NitT/TauT family transport system ATP-binding protein
LRIHRWGTPDRIRRRVVELLDRVGLDDPELRARQYPHELSGGMRQRTALARVLAQEAEIVLMDEPFAALDAMTRDSMHDEIERLHLELGLTVVFVTHNVREAVRLSNRTVLFTSSPGQVKSEIKVPFDRPRAVYEIRATPQYGQLMYSIWELLRDEVLRAKREEGTEGGAEQNPSFKPPTRGRERENS